MELDGNKYINSLRFVPFMHAANCCATTYASAIAASIVTRIIKFIEPNFSLNTRTQHNDPKWEQKKKEIA